MNGKNWARLLIRSTALYVSLLTIVGFILRVYALGARGFWFDEIVFAFPSRLPTFDALIAHVQEWSDHTPLSFFLVWFARGLGGDEASVRLPFAIVGTLGIPTLYLLGKTIANVRVGFIAALLYAISPFAVFISQDAHPYAPLMLFGTLQAFFAYRAAESGRWLDWAGFGLFTILNLYNDYLALAVTAVGVSFLGLVLLIKLVTVLRQPTLTGTARTGMREVREQIIAFGVTLAAVFILYIPWLEPTRTFLRMPVRTFYSTRTGGATLDDLLALASNLGFNVLLAALLLVGVVYMLLSLRRGNRLPAMLLLIWVFPPLAALWLLAGDRLFLLQTRYFSFLLPAAIVLAAIGTDRLADLVRFAHKRFYAQRAGGADLPPYVSGAAFATLAMLILAFNIPALLASYSWSKPAPQSFREAAKTIISGSPPGSIALSVGMWGDKPAPPFTIQGVEYYLWLYKSPIPYIDASLLDKRLADQMVPTGTVIWGVWALPTPMPAEAVNLANSMGLDVIPLENLTLIRARDTKVSTAQQLDTMLAWGTGIQSGLAATRAVLNPEYKAESLGENILPPISAANVQDPQAGDQTDKWRVPGNASISPNGGTFVLNATDPKTQINVKLSTEKLTPGKTYVVSFSYSNAQLEGEQRVYLSSYTKEGQLIETFPYGAGFVCPEASDSTSAFLFTMPPNGTNALLWLRIVGEGQAEFSNVEIRPLR